MVIKHFVSLWSTWEAVTKKSYFTKCCSCGCVHEWQFKIVKDIRGRERIVYRVRRSTKKAYDNA